MKNKLVVLGGSFNPPTVAHLRLMQAAMEAAGADRGLFVPAPFGYVLQRLKKEGFPQETLPDAVRMEMLAAMCQNDPRLGVNGCALHGGRDFPRGMRKQLQEEYPDSELYFLTDKESQGLRAKWHRVRPFAQEFILLMAKSEGMQSPPFLTRRILSQHWETFAAFSLAGELDQVSSSAFQAKLCEGNVAARKLVTDEVWELLQDYKTNGNRAGCKD